MALNTNYLEKGNAKIRKSRIHWALLTLLASQPFHRARFRPFVARAAEVLLQVDPGQDSLRYRRDRIRHLLNEMAAFGAIDLRKSKSQTSEIRLMHIGAKKQFGHDAIDIMVSRIRKKKTDGVKYIAHKLGVRERTVWKWLAGEATPHIRYIVHMSLLYGSDELDHGWVMSMLVGLEKFYGEVIGVLALNPKEEQRARKWLIQHHYERFKSGAEELMGERFSPLKAVNAFVESKNISLSPEI